jgi:galactokinase
MPPRGLVDAYRRHFGPPAFFVRAPGRVDLIGAHVDYNDGFVLPAAIDRNVWLAVGPARSTTTVVALDLGTAASFDTDRLAERVDMAGQPLPTWARYPGGVAWALHTAGLSVPPLAAVLTGDVPVGAGVSSSAAVEIAFALAWRELGGWDLPLMDLARLCRRAENEYVGVACGLMDQFAAAFGQRDHALLLDCRSLDWQTVSLPPQVAVVIADTTTRRQLSDGALNTRQAECQAALRELQACLPHIAALRDVTAEEIATYGPRLAEPGRSRAQHVVAECRRVLAVAAALRDGDAVRAGHLMDESHVSARDLYGASGPALEAMWAAAHGHPACLGGRFIGAGFAGCLVFLVRADDTADFIGTTASRFALATGIVADLYATGIADGAAVVET